MLASMAPRRGIQSQKHLANILAQKLGAEYSWETLKSHINKMVKLGLLAKTNDGWTVTIPEGVVEIVKPEPKHEPPQKEIIEELNKAPARKRCALSTQERWEIIRQAWNTYKPEGFEVLKETKDKALFAALESHTRHMKIARTEYGPFIKRVCLGLAQNDWWMDKAKKNGPIKATSVFGRTVDLEDRKLKSVQSLHNAVADEVSGFDHRNDQQVLAWYKKAMPGSAEFLEKGEVHRIEVEEGPMIPAIESYCMIQRKGENGGILNTEDEEMIAKFGEINSAWHTGQAPIRVYYLKNRPDPTNWTYRHDYDGLRNLPTAPIK